MTQGGLTYGGSAYASETESGPVTVNLSWTDNADNENGFEIFRGTSSGSLSSIATVSANTTSYADTGLRGGDTYYYRVEGYTEHTSSTTLEQSIETSPKAPTNTTLDTSVEDEGAISWTDNASIEDGYYVYRSTDGTNFTRIATLAPNTESYIDTGASDGEKYWYYISSYVNNIESDGSTVDGITVHPTDSDLSVSPASDTSLSVSWTDNHDNEDGRYVYYSNDGGSTWTQFSDIGANTTSETITGLTQDTTYKAKTEVYTEHKASESNIDDATTYLNESRSVSSYGTPIRGGVVRQVDLVRDTNSHSDSATSSAVRVMDVKRNINSHSGKSTSAVDRGQLNYAGRTIDIYSTMASSSAKRIVDLGRDVDSYGNGSSSSVFRVVDLNRVPNSHSDKLTTSANRGQVDYAGRTVSSFAGKMVSWAYDDRTSLELIDYNVTWNDEKAVWHTPWVNEYRVLGDEDTFVVRGSVVENSEDPTAMIVIQYDEDGNGVVDKESDPIRVARDEQVHEVSEIPVTESGQYRMKINEYGGYNSLYSLDMGIVH